MVEYWLGNFLSTSNSSNLVYQGVAIVNGLLLFGYQSLLDSCSNNQPGSAGFSACPRKTSVGRHTVTIP